MEGQKSGFLTSRLADRGRAVGRRTPATLAARFSAPKPRVAQVLCGRTPPVTRRAWRAGAGVRTEGGVPHALRDIHRMATRRGVAHVYDRGHRTQPVQRLSRE